MSFFEALFWEVNLVILIGCVLFVLAGNSFNYLCNYLFFITFFFFTAVIGLVDQVFKVNVEKSNAKSKDIDSSALSMSSPASSLRALRLA
jgi:hypothetical protein